jgi:multiple sugar transport system substrate-binding protein
MKVVLPRRRFLALGFGLAASSVLAACGSAPAPTAAPAKPTEPAKSDAKPAGAATTAPAAPTTAAAAAATKPAGATPAAAAPAKSGEPVKLRMAWWGGEARAKKYNQALDLYESKNAAKITRETAEFNPYWEKMNTQMAGGNPPDLINMHSQVTQFLHRNVLVPLDSYVSSGTLNLKDVEQWEIDTGKFNGKIMMVSYGVTTPAVFYNTELFKKAGVEAPKSGWTWEDFSKTATNISKALDKQAWGTTDQGAWAGSFEIAMLQRGKPLFTKEGKLGVTKEDVAAHWKMWEDLRKSGGAPPAERSAEDTGVQADSMLAKSKAAMHIINANQLQIYQGYNKDKLALVRVPNGPQPAYATVGTYYSIAQKSAAPDETAKLLNFLVNDPDVAKIFLAEYGPPASKKMQQLVEPMLNEATVAGNKLVGEISKDVKLEVWPAQGGAVTTQIGKVYQETMFGRLSVDAAAERFVAEANKILG